MPFLLLLCLFLPPGSTPETASEKTPDTHLENIPTPHPPDAPQDRVAFEHLVLDAFHRTHDGYSVDETLIQPALQTLFHAACAAQHLATPAPPPTRATDTLAEACNRTLLRLRKRGDIGAVTTRRPTPLRLSPEQTQRYRVAAEIAARQVLDQHGDRLDDTLCQPAARQRFLQAAQQILTPAPGNHPAPEAVPDAERLTPADAAGGISGGIPGGTSGGGDEDVLDDELQAHLLREALALRKRRRLRPELVARVVDWGREVHVYALTELRADPSVLPEGPGVYLFRDATGYLYIGEAANLRTRLTQHLNNSDRTALAAYLQTTPPTPAPGSNAGGDTEDDSEGGSGGDSGGEGSTPDIHRAPAEPGPLSIEVHAFDPASDARRVGHRRAYESELIASRRPRFNVRP